MKKTSGRSYPRINFHLLMIINVGQLVSYLPLATLTENRTVLDMQFNYLSDLGHISDKFIYEYCFFFFFGGKRNKEIYEEDKVKEVTLTEWMGLAAPPIELRFNFALDDHLFAKIQNQC